MEILFGFKKTMLQISTIEWLGHLVSSWALFGLIWTVQLSHYPTFRYIGEADFPAFHQHHTSSIVIIVLSLMLLELGIVGWQAYQSGWNWMWVIPLCIVLGIWASTFFVQIPLHGKLEMGKDLQVIEQLVKTNWVRTVLWSVKAGWVSYFFSW